MKTLAKFIALVLALSLVSCNKDDPKKPDPKVVVPTVQTGSISDISRTSFTVAGKVTSNGGADVTEVGICIGESANPETKYQATLGTEFSVVYDQAEAGKTYYVRAYAVNSAGIAYGEDKNVTASADAEVTVVDENLQAFLEFTFDANEDGIFSQSEAEAVDSLCIPNEGIKTLEGIEKLPNLVAVIADHNPIARLVVNNLPNLKVLNVAFTSVPLEEVSVQNLPALVELDINDCNPTFKSLTLDLPALETLNMSVMHELETLDIKGCTSLKVLNACQLYAVKEFDLSTMTQLEYCWIPDPFAATSIKMPASDKLWYFGAWNAKALTSIDLSNCPNLKEIVMNDSYEVAEIKLNCAGTLENFNINCFRKLKSLDLTDYTNIVNLNIIQLYECETLKLPSSLSKLNMCWAADALKVKELTFNGVPAGARVAIWNCPLLETFNYTSNQEVIGWNYDLSAEGNPNVVTDAWTIPGNDIKTFNITAPNCKILFASNLHALTGTFDLKGCPKLEDLTAPDLWVATGVDYSNCPNLHRILMWNWNEITSVDISGCAQTMSEVNVGTGDVKCNKLETIYIREGQVINTIFKESNVNIVTK